MAFIYIHAAWFSLWVLLNIGLLHVPHDPEVHALSASPTAGEVLQVIEEAVQEEAKEVKQTVGKVTQGMAGEIRAAREGVDRVGEQVEGVATDLNEVKEPGK